MTHDGKRVSATYHVPILWLVLLFGLLFFFSADAALAHREAVSVRQFGGKGETQGRWGEAVFWDFDRDGNIYVSDTENLRVQKFSASGKWLFSIDNPEKEGAFTFRNPSDIAVDGLGRIFVADWALLTVPGYEDPSLYTYTPCVHQFAEDGTWSRTFPLQPPEDSVQFMDQALPGLDADGHEILIIPQGDIERTFRLTATSAGDLFVLDEGSLYHFDASGNISSIFPGARRYPGWFKSVTDIVASDLSSIYLLDTKRHRIVELSKSGDIRNTIGSYGDQDGQLESPEQLAILENGSLLVADQAHYDRIVDSLLERHPDDPSAHSIYDATGQRHLHTRFLRAQKFSKQGHFVEKILIRLNRDDSFERTLRWFAVSRTGQLYLQHPETLVVEQYTPSGGPALDALRTELSLHYEQDEMTVEIDNPEDTDGKRDFDETWRLQLVAADLAFHYSYDERIQISWYHNGLYLYSKQEDFYAQESEDIARGAFNQSDKTLEDYVAGITRLDFSWVLRDAPYDYRTAGVSLYLGGGRYGVTNDAIDTANQRYLNWDLWFSEWGGSFHYDIAKRWQMHLDISHGPANGYFNYEFDYIDELGVLFATGFREGNQTQVFLAIDGVF